MPISDEFRGGNRILLLVIVLSSSATFCQKLFSFPLFVSFCFISSVSASSLTLWGARFVNYYFWLVQ